MSPEALTAVIAGSAGVLGALVGSIAGAVVTARAQKHEREARIREAAFHAALEHAHYQTELMVKVSEKNGAGLVIEDAPFLVEGYFTDFMSIMQTGKASEHSQKVRAQHLARLGLRTGPRGEP